MATFKKQFTFNSEKHYLGKPCKYGHDGYRFISTDSCCRCAFDNARTEKRKKYEKEYRENKINSIHSIAVSLLCHTRRRSITNKHCQNFNLTLNWLKDKISNGVCEVTGIPFDINNKTEYRVNPFYPSIDKINPKNGYTIDNCRLVCYIYNIAKGEFSDEILLTFAKRLIESNADCTLY
jgi:hypothetical protein